MRSVGEREVRNARPNLHQFAAVVDRLLSERAFRSCLVGDKHCAGGICKAHSVQSHLLEHIAEDGHVYMFENRPPTAHRLVRVGINKATTFTGFCAHHDLTLFRRVDFGDRLRFDPANKEQIVLLSLRAVAREYWAKLNVERALEFLVDLCRSGNEKEIKRVLDVDERHVRLLIRAAGTSVAAHLEGTRSAIPRLERAYESLYSQMSKRKYHLSQTRTYRIPHRRGVAAATAFQPEFDLEGTRIADLRPGCDIPYIVLNIIPWREGTCALFMWHRRFSHHLARLFRQLDVCGEADLRVALSKMLVVHCENVVFTPRLIRELSVEQRNALQTDFARTITGAVPYDEVPAYDFLPLDDL